MRKMLLLTAGAVLVFANGCVTSMPSIGKDQAPALTAETSLILRHVVLFKFKEGVTPEQIKQVEEGFRKLPSQIDTVVDFEWGTNVSKAELSEGFTHCIFMTFINQKGLDAYIPHPAHQAFGELVKPLAEKILVLDYYARE